MGNGCMRYQVGINVQRRIEGMVQRWTFDVRRSRFTLRYGGLVVKPRARILHGHDWVFSGEVLKVFGNPADGDVISLKDGRDHLIGSAIYNSKSQIVARRFSRRRQDLDLDFSSAGSRKRRSIGSGAASICDFVASSGARAMDYPV